jgi:hypothetical protein
MLNTTNAKKASLSRPAFSFSGCRSPVPRLSAADHPERQHDENRDFIEHFPAFSLILD